MVTNKEYYRSISLRSQVHEKLETLTDKIVPGVQLSKAKAVEKLVNDSWNEYKGKE